MSNATGNLATETMGSGPFVFDVPVKASTHIYKGTLIAQHSGGYFVPATTSGAGAVVGVAQHEQDNSSGSNGDKRVRVETCRMYAFTNGTSGDAFSDTSKIGAPAYAVDDHTVADNSNSGANPCVGIYMGFESDGKVRVLVSPGIAFVVNVLTGLQTLTDSPASADALRDEIVAVAAKLL